MAEESNREKSATSSMNMHMNMNEKTNIWNEFELSNKTKYFFAVRSFEQFKKQYYKLAYRIGESISQKSS